MIKRLIDKLGSTVYVQIWENRIKVVDVISGVSFDEPPLVAIESTEKGQKTIVAVGNEVKSMSPSESIEIVNPFLHPRALINDFIVAEKVLQHAFHLTLGKKFISPAPAVVIHPMDKTEGGLTMIEKKAFRELALGAGAREVELYLGSELSVVGFNFAKIKEANSTNENMDVGLKPKKENYWLLAFWVMVLIGILWISN